MITSLKFEAIMKMHIEATRYLKEVDIILQRL